MERPRPDLYRVLQVDPAANPLVIQAAYRVLAQIFHPDVAGDEDEMKRINAAWEVLGDSARRRAYDLERGRLRAGPSPVPAAPAPQTRSEGHAGPPEGHAFGPVMRYGRYEGWSLGQIERVDRPFLEWLRRVPAGRAIRDDIDAVLRRTKASPAFAHRRRDEPEAKPVHTWAPGSRTAVR